MTGFWSVGHEWIRTIHRHMQQEIKFPAIKFMNGLFAAHDLARTPFPG